MLFFLYRGNRKVVLFTAAVMITAIAVIDWYAAVDLPLGFLYLFPIIFVGSVLNRFQIGVIAAICTFLAEIFDEFEWNPRTGITRDILYFAAFYGVGLFVHEFIRSRQAALEHLQRIEEESQAKQAAEEQLNILIESSPAAVFTANAEGTILLANDAAHRLFGLKPTELTGQLVATYLPSLANVDVKASDRQSLRTVMECRGWRADGEVFLADVWFSTYRTSVGPRLAAMVIDVSDNLRNHEELSLQQVLSSSRILVGAVSHEVRNVCGAIAVVHQNLARTGILAKNQDFEALGTLILTLERIASLDFSQSGVHSTATDLASLLHELRIIIEPSLQERSIAVEWAIQQDLPMVWADRQSLIQVFLNLVKNSARAMDTEQERHLRIATHTESDKITVRVTDTGCGVARPERLFQPFQPEAENTGLGLYLSRAFMRSFRGDLRYEPEIKGASFVVELTPAHSAEDESNDEPAYKNIAD
jgi:PAS domain S-box-containing protein